MAGLSCGSKAAFVDTEENNATDIVRGSGVSKCVAERCAEVRWCLSFFEVGLKFFIPLMARSACVCRKEVASTDGDRDTGRKG